MAKKVLVAGATGYLGRYMIRELKEQGYEVRVLARNPERLSDLKPYIDQIFTAEVTKAEQLKGVCEGVDIVFSSIGITRQKDGVTYWDVDYRGNMNLLFEAKNSGVEKFMYISVLNAHQLGHVEIVKAKEAFVTDLKSSGINYIVVRPNGFFSDMTEFFEMAKKGTVHLFGNGGFKSNPIHGMDLAEFCVKSLTDSNVELSIGGPDILTQNEIVSMMESILGKPVKSRYYPIWLKNLIVRLMKWFTSMKTYGPVEFFMNVLTIDMVTLQFGKHRLQEYYTELHNHSD